VLFRMRRISLVSSCGGSSISRLAIATAVVTPSRHAHNTALSRSSDKTVFALSRGWLVDEVGKGCIDGPGVDVDFGSNLDGSIAGNDVLVNPLTRVDVVHTQETAEFLPGQEIRLVVISGGRGGVSHDGSGMVSAAYS